MQDYPPSPSLEVRNSGPSSGLVCTQQLGELPKLPFKIRSLHYYPLANFWLDSLSKDLLLHLFCPKANSIGWYLPFRRLTGFISLRTHA